MTMDMSHEVALDAETRYDHNGELQLLSVAIVDSESVLLYMPIRPLGLSCEEIGLINNLPFSAEVHAHASPASVARNVVKELLRGTTVIVWNEEHERRLFPFLNEKDHKGRDVFPVQDAMKRAAPYVKGWNPYFSAYEYPKLGPSADHFGFEFAEPGWHDARADAQMTLRIWQHMEKNPPFPIDSPIIAPLPALPPSAALESDFPF